MKYFLTFVFGMFLATNAHAVLSMLCMTRIECQAELDTLGSTYRCCARTQTSYTCPTGWYALGTSTCYRFPVANGESDEKGYLGTKYGSCAATSSTKTCYYTTTGTCLATDLPIDSELEVIQ